MLQIWVRNKFFRRQSDLISAHRKSFVRPRQLTNDEKKLEASGDRRQEDTLAGAVEQHETRGQASTYDWRMQAEEYIDSEEGFELEGIGREKRQRFLNIH